MYLGGNHHNHNGPRKDYNQPSINLKVSFWTVLVGQGDDPASCL
jgi:hypothetical protein